MKQQPQSEEKALSGFDNEAQQILGQLTFYSPRDRKIAELCLQGFNGAEIGKFIGLSRGRISQILKYLRLVTIPRKVTNTCELCQKSYTKFRTLAIRNKHHYCSSDCFNKARNASSIKFPCHVCGKLVHRSPNRRASIKRVFCSSKCYYSVRQTRPYVAWREGQRKARKAVAAYCKLEPGYVVHHHDGNNRNNALENLAVFASQADHMTHHHGLTPIKPIWDGRQL